MELAISAVAILIDTKHGQRFFHAFGKSGCVQTSWSLAGAKLFLKIDERIEKTTQRLESKNKKFKLHHVFMNQMPVMED
ncbi:hypothetical protein ABRZ58_15295 [Vibrio vulnificus]|uniref:hypothetical protein n=1 Tax=Vibrio vulnificus TaxID=672 RepID=UPI0005F12964|nr:hypothetical protein [Vibrio vulnificus]